MKQHTIYERMHDAPDAYLSNGMVGLRVGRNPMQEISALLSGFSTRLERHEVEALAPVPCPKIDIITGSVNPMSGRSMLTGPSSRFAFKAQSYDFSCGELTTRFAFRPSDGRDIDCEHIVFCSRSSPTLYLTRLTLTASADVDATLCVRLDAADMPIQTKHIIHTSDCDGSMLLSGEGDTAASRAGVSLITQWTGDGEREQRTFFDYESRAIESRVILHLKAGAAQHFTVITSCVPGALHHEPHLQAIRMIKLALWEGFDALREKNRAAWADIWRGRVTIKGADAQWQDWLDSAFFYLNSTLHTSTPFSIAPCGLGHRFLYKGHVFWDTESFMFLPPLLTAPEVAEALLDYRFDRLEAARNNARIQGYRGIQFPWQSFATGDEVTRSSANQAGGAGEQHVNMDVALAFALYAHATGDPVFIRERAWPVLRGVSQWIESRVTRTDRGYEILHVTGIEEEIDNVNNNAYTNILCRKVLEEANRIGQQLGYPENRKWSMIADGLLIPVHPEYGHIQQYEGAPMRDELSCELMMAYFPYCFRAGKEMDEHTLRTYFERGLEKQLCYPMLSGFLGVIPAWLGERTASLRFFEKGSGPFLREPYLTSVEWVARDGSDPDNMPTPFLTGRASLLSGVMLGLTRINLFKEGDEMFEGPIILPEGWEEITLHRVYLKGRAARITARHGEAQARVEWLDD